MAGGALGRRRRQRPVTSVLWEKLGPTEAQGLIQNHRVLIIEVFYFFFLITHIFCQELRILGWDLVYASGLINFELSVQPKEYHYLYLTISKKHKVSGLVQVSHLHLVVIIFSDPSKRGWGGVVAMKILPLIKSFSCSVLNPSLHTSHRSLLADDGVQQGY